MIKYLLVWHNSAGDFAYGYKTYNEVLKVIETFKGNKYVHYSVYQINNMQKLLFREKENN